MRTYTKITPRMVRADLRRMERGQATRLDAFTLAHFVLSRLTFAVSVRVTRKAQDAVRWLEALYRLPDPRG